MCSFWKQQRKMKKYVVSSIVRQDNDNRPYIALELFNKTFLALLDSGANKCVVGGKLAKLIPTDHPGLRKLKCYVRAADGQNQNVTATIVVPIHYNSLSQDVEFLIVPSIKQDIICGMDFWKLFGLRISSPTTISEISDSNDLSDTVLLNATDRNRLQAVIEFFPSSEKSGLAKSTLIEHHIDTGAAKAIKQRYYNLSPAKELQLCQEVDRMISLGVLEEAPASSWSSPAVLVVKPGKMRICLDSRKLNSVTVKDAYPTSLIEGLLSRLLLQPTP